MVIVPHLSFSQIYTTWKFFIGSAFSSIPVGFRQFKCLFWVTWVKKNIPSGIFMTEVISSRSYLRKCSIWMGPPRIINFFHFLKVLICLKLEPNIFKIFTSLWYLPLVTISKKKMLEVRVTCHGWFNMALPSAAFFSLNSCCDHCRNVYTHFHSSSCLGNILLHQNHATY